VWTIIGGQEQLVSFDIRDGMIHQIYAILNPDKLAFVRRAASPCTAMPSQGSPGHTANDTGDDRPPPVRRRNTLIRTRPAPQTTLRRRLSTRRES
jgi:hypothetical protein